VVTMGRAIGMRHHSTPRTICSIEWCTSPAVPINCTPSSLAREDSIMEAVERAWAGAVDEGGMAHERDVVEAEVPNGGIRHAVRAESHQGTNYCSGEDVVLRIC
jgi:hypothetical protein